MSTLARLKFNPSKFDVVSNRPDFPFYCMYDDAIKRCDEENGYLWTIIEEGYRTWTISPRFRLINSLAYLVTRKRPPDIAQDYIFPSNW